MRVSCSLIAARSGIDDRYWNVSAFSASIHCFVSGESVSSSQRYGSATVVPK